MDPSGLFPRTDVRLDSIGQGIQNLERSEEAMRQMALQSQLAQEDLLAKRESNYQAQQNRPLLEAQRGVQLQEAQALGAPGVQEELVGGKLTEVRGKKLELERAKRLDRSDQVAEILFPIVAGTKQGDFVGAEENFSEILDRLEKAGAPNMADIRKMPRPQAMQLLKGLYERSINVASQIRGQITEEAKFKREQRGADAESVRKEKAAQAQQPRDIELANIKGGWSVKAAEAAARASGSAAKVSPDQVAGQLMQAYHQGQTLTEEQQNVLRNWLINEYKTTEGAQGVKRIEGAVERQLRETEKGAKRSGGYAALTPTEKRYMKRDPKGYSGSATWSSPEARTEYKAYLERQAIESQLRSQFPRLFSTRRGAQEAARGGESAGRLIFRDGKIQPK